MADKFSLTVDIVITDGDNIVLVKRGIEPYKGRWCLPGGHVDNGELVEDAAKREAKEETNLDVRLVGIIGAYSDPKRDPREYKPGIAFVSQPLSNDIKGGDDAVEARWFEPEEIDFDELAFDHAKIIKDFLKWRVDGETFWSSKKD